MVTYHDGRIHSRISITPSGFDPLLCLTVGNLHSIRLNRLMALTMGGTFIVQFEDLLAPHMSIQYRGDRTPYIENALQQMSHFGQRPSPASFLETLDIPGKCSVMVASDYEGEVEWAWRELLPFRKHLPPNYQNWPPPFPIDAHSNDQAIAWRFGGSHPYILTGRVVMDSISRRNCFANGDECRSYHDLYCTIWALLHGEGAPPPQQFSVPLVRQADLKGLDSIDRELAMQRAAVISVSTSAGGDLYWVHTAMGAFNYHELWDFWDDRTLYPGGRIGGNRGTDVLSGLKPWPVIDDSEWKKHLATYRQSKQRAAQAVARKAEKERQVKRKKRKK